MEVHHHYSRQKKDQYRAASAVSSIKTHSQVVESFSCPLTSKLELWSRPIPTALAARAGAKLDHRCLY